MDLLPLLPVCASKILNPTGYSESDGSILYTNKNKMYKKEHSDVYKRAVLEETIYINNIEKIIRDNRGDMDSLILNLSKLPLSELKSDTKNPYYIKLAIEKKAELDRESKATYVHPQKIINELTKISKNSNPRYKEKVAFNKRNNLDYKGRPKKWQTKGD